MGKYLLSGLFVFIAISMSIAQNIELKGIVKSHQSGEPVPYASIVFADKQYGTYSDENGAFTLTANSEQLMVFSALGYKKITLTTSQIASLGNVVTLEENPVELNEIIVTDKKNKEKSRLETFGYHGAEKKSRLVAKTPGFQIATRIENPRKTSGYIEKIILNVVSNGKSRIRLHLYPVENFPAEQTELIPENLLIDVSLKKGLQKVDVSSYGLEFPEQGLIIGVEFLGNVRNGKVDIVNGVEIGTKIFLSQSDSERNTWIGFMGKKFEREFYSNIYKTNCNAMVGLAVRFFEDNPIDNQR